jgi:hypothetical protein
VLRPCVPRPPLALRDTVRFMVRFSPDGSLLKAAVPRFAIA